MTQDQFVAAAIERSQRNLLIHRREILSIIDHELKANDHQFHQQYWSKLKKEVKSMIDKNKDHKP